MRYFNDPSWVISTVDRKCNKSKCFTYRKVKIGETVFCFPISKAFFCAECSKEESAIFTCNSFDEANY